MHGFQDVQSFAYVVPSCHTQIEVKSGHKKVKRAARLNAKIYRNVTILNGVLDKHEQEHPVNRAAVFQSCLKFYDASILSIGAKFADLESDIVENIFFCFRWHCGHIHSTFRSGQSNVMPIVKWGDFKSYAMIGCLKDCRTVAYRSKPHMVGILFRGKAARMTSKNQSSTSIHVAWSQKGSVWSQSDLVEETIYISYKARFV